METTYTLGNKTLAILHDDCAESPRSSMDNLGTMACAHGRYTLGDPNKTEKIIGSKKPHAVQSFIKRKDVISLPIYMYDHSGITIKTTPFSCPWDSGLVGYIFVTKETVRKEFGINRVTKEWVEKIKGYLNSEVETYDIFLRGEMYGFRIEENGEEVDSCWGFFGSDPLTNGMSDNFDEEWIELLKKEVA